MEVVLASIAFAVATLACVERIVRARRAAWMLATLPPLVATWVLLWLLRMPPTAGHALLAFALADLAVLAISIVAVVRMLGGFERAADDDGRDGHDDAADQPVHPGPRPGRAEARTHPHPRRPPGPRRPRARPTAARPPRSATESASRGSSTSSSGRTG